jgi:hypothetical protein
MANGWRKKWVGGVSSERLEVYWTAVSCVGLVEQLYSSHYSYAMRAVTSKCFGLVSRNDIYTSGTALWSGI